MSIPLILALTLMPQLKGNGFTYTKDRIPQLPQGLHASAMSDMLCCIQSQQSSRVAMHSSALKGQIDLSSHVGARLTVVLAPQTTHLT